MGYKQEMSKQVDGATVVDWAKAPEDAQYYIAESDDAFEGFIKIEEGRVHCFVPSQGMTDWCLDWMATVDEVESDENMIKKEIQ